MHLTFEGPSLNEPLTALDRDAQHVSTSEALIERLVKGSSEGLSWQAAKDGGCLLTRAQEAQTVWTQSARSL